MFSITESLETLNWEVDDYKYIATKKAESAFQIGVKRFVLKIPQFWYKYVHQSIPELRCTAACSDNNSIVKPTLCILLSYSMVPSSKDLAILCKKKFKLQYVYTVSLHESVLGYLTEDREQNNLLLS